MNEPDPLQSVGGETSSVRIKSPLMTDDKFCQGFFCGAYLVLGIISFVSKILMPMLIASAEGFVWLTYITWDIWWIAYLYIAWQIQFPSKKIWIFAILTALIDFFISSYKLIMATQIAIWDIWKTSLFFNNLYSFILSFLLFFYLFSHSTRIVFGVKPVQIPPEKLS